MKLELSLVLKLCFKSVGVTLKIVCNGALKQIKGELRKLCNRCDCKVVHIERGTTCANRAELHVGIIKSQTKTKLEISNYPMKL